MSKIHFQRWQQTECNECGNTFQITRTEELTLEESEILCGDCQLWHDAHKQGYKEGFKDGYKKASKFYKEINIKQELIIEQLKDILHYGSHGLKEFRREEQDT